MNLDNIDKQIEEIENIRVITPKMRVKAALVLFGVLGLPTCIFAGLMALLFMGYL